MESSHGEEKIYKRYQNKYFFSGEKRFSKLLFPNLQGRSKGIKEMKREKHEGPSTRSIQEEGSKSSSYGYEHSAISSYIPCSIRNFFMKRKKGDMPKRDTLGDFLQGYEDQSKEFKDHLNFQRFFQTKEERRKK